MSVELNVQQIPNFWLMHARFLSLHNVCAVTSEGSATVASQISARATTWGPDMELSQDDHYIKNSIVH